MIAIAITNNVNIKGISENNKEIKIRQYADDTTMIFHCSKYTLLSSLAMLDDFSKVSGLRLRDKKTEALWIGSSFGNDKILLLGKDLKWPSMQVKRGSWTNSASLLQGGSQIGSQSKLSQGDVGSNPAQGVKFKFFLPMNCHPGVVRPWSLH